LYYISMLVKKKHQKNSAFQWLMAKA